MDTVMHNSPKTIAIQQSSQQELVRNLSWGKEVLVRGRAHTKE